MMKTSKYEPVLYVASKYYNAEVKVSNSETDYDQAAAELANYIYRAAPNGAVEPITQRLHQGLLGMGLDIDYKDFREMFYDVLERMCE
jgi:hypothetical protein